MSIETQFSVAEFLVDANAAIDGLDDVLDDLRQSIAGPPEANAVIIERIGVIESARRKLIEAMDMIAELSPSQ